MYTRSTSSDTGIRLPIKTKVKVEYTTKQGNIKENGDIYPLSFKVQVSVVTKNNLGKALSLRHGYSLTKVNNAA